MPRRAMYVLILLGCGLFTASVQAEVIVGRFYLSGALDKQGFNGGWFIGTGGQAATFRRVVARGLKVHLGGGLQATVKGRLATRLVVGRLNVDGTPDTSFGYGGITTWSSPFSEESDHNLIDLAVDDAGRIVVLGHLGRPGRGSMFLVRFNSDGSLDPGFGTADNRFVLPSDGIGHPQPRAVRIGSDGSIVVIADHQSTGLMYVYKLNPSGQLAWTARPSFLKGSSTSSGTTLEIDSAGRIVVLGYVSDSMVGVLRLTPGGAMDTNFGSGGRTTYTWGYGLEDIDMVVSERLNKTIVIAAKTADFNHFNVMLARFNNVGVNTESTIYENRKYRRSSPGLSIAVSNATGRFFVGTSAYNPEPPERRFAVVRFYDTVFLPDPNFGDPNGFASASFPGLDVLPMDMSVDVLNNMPVVGGSVLP